MWEFEPPLIILLMALSFMLSAAETALTSLGRLELISLLREGGTGAKAIQRWVKEPSRLLIVILVGNNAANIAASSLVTLWASRHFGQNLGLVMGIFTFFVIVAAEIVPKLIARRTAMQVAPYAVSFLYMLGFVLWPIIWLMQKLSTGIVILSGMPGREQRKPITEEELEHTIEIAAKEGGIDRETGDALANLLGFPDTPVRHFMLPRARIVYVSLNWTREEVVRRVTSDGHSRYPVIQGDNLDDVVGILLVKDLLQDKAFNGPWTRVVRKPYFISEMATAGKVLRTMKRKGRHMALVRNETGVITGLLTFEDLMEEIVGDIRDEHDDPEAAGAEKAMGGPQLVSGEMPVLDFNDRFGASLPLNSSYGTLNGYLLYKMGGQLPPVGTLVFAEDVTFRIHSIDENGVSTVEILQT